MDYLQRACHFYLQLWFATIPSAVESFSGAPPPHPALNSSRFGRATCLDSACRNCKHFYPTLHHLLITCPSTFLKGARKTLRDDLRDAISSPLRSQLQALLPGFLGRIDFLLLDWDMQDFGELYGPLSSLDSPECVQNGHTL